MMLSLSLFEIVIPVGLVGLQYHLFIPNFMKICQLEGSVWLSNAHTHIYMHVGKEPSLYVVAALVLLWASDHVGDVATETGTMCSRKDVT